MYTIIANSKKRKKALPDYSELKLGNTTYYNFDEPSGTISYDSVGSNNTTSSGIDLGITGLVGKGVSSPGGGEKRITFSKTVIDDNAIYTSFWFYYESGSVLRMLNRAGGSTGNGFGLILGDLGGINRVIASYYGIADLPNGTAGMNINEWNHIVIEKTGLNTKIYINNTLKYNESRTTFKSSNGDWFIGCYLNVNGGVITDSGGKFKIDELGVWNRPLTSDEITQLYNSGNGIQLYEYDPYLPLKTGNITYYKFNEPSGSVSYDSVGSNNATSSGIDLGVTGLIDKGISSTGGGSSKYLMIPKATINQNAMYISTWYYAESDSLFNITSRQSSTGYNISAIGSSDTIKVTYYGIINFPEVSADLIFNEWNHIVIEKTGLTTKVYINNVLKFNGYNPSYNITTTDTYIGVGLNLTGNPESSQKFKLDELGIWNRVLSSDERTQLYNSGNGFNLYP